MADRIQVPRIIPRADDYDAAMALLREIDQFYWPPDDELVEEAALIRRVHAVVHLQAGKTCEPFDDPRSHDFQGWKEFDDGRGGTSICTRCGISALSHAIRYAP